MQTRGKFATSFGVLTATLGSAVGLGNIWKFPYITGKFGGAAFIIVYLICVALASLPVMISEIVVGRRTNSNAVGAFKKLKPYSAWPLIGYAGIASSFLIMFFYTGVAGWVYSYIFRALGGTFVNATSDVTGTIFKGLITDSLSPIIWQVVVLLVVSVIIIAGVEKGIERITKALMPLLFILLILCDIRALTLPGASMGVKFLFNPDFTVIKGDVLLIALGLAFFKLSVGMGTMITYGSYFGKQENIPATAVKVALSDIVVSMMAGLAIFPAVFAFGFKPDAGPGLLFITIPMVFSKMPMGNVLLAVFFLLTAIAATTAMISLLEVPVAYLVDEKGWPRWKATVLSTGIIALIGSTASLSADPAGVLGATKIFGKTFFDLYDYISSNILMPLGGIFIVIFVGWFFGKRNLQMELSNRGRLKNGVFLNVFLIITRFVSPVLIALVFLNAIGILKI
ncbi:sodium-dependent transporter [Biomaibacter acetigenes]|uniref:Sodium-dependent transporter n=1 Tax=Biomaibacter acetigenes TaxID=2316383 RepID=A0A3G2R5U6_9FIRM|nr:sodium-dependent transporter [Biomaibacter acetigenes]AYO30934.1 sodium-dependent transporter [Biomaibacter acetigenes]